MFICLFIYLFIFVYSFLIFNSSICLFFVYLFVCLSIFCVCLLVYLSICLFVCVCVRACQFSYSHINLPYVTIRLCSLMLDLHRYHPGSNESQQTNVNLRHGSRPKVSRREAPRPSSTHLRHCQCCPLKDGEEPIKSMHNHKVSTTETLEIFNYILIYRRE